jgi:hypothetical protein
MNIDYSKITDNPRVIELLKQRTEIENKIKAIDETALIKHELELLSLPDVGSSLPDLRECNQASFDYATKKDYPDFFLIKQTFKEGINWALNYVTKKN